MGFDVERGHIYFQSGNKKLRDLAFELGKEVNFREIRAIYAFPGGQPSVKEHREKGGNPNVDVSFLYLKYFFEEDDNKLEQIARDYRNGSLLTGELKEYFIEKVNSYLKEHRRRREIVAKNIDKYMLRD